MNNLQSFSNLNSIVNFYTPSTPPWGNMRISEPDSLVKFVEAFRLSGKELRENQLVYMSVEHSDGIRFIDKNNVSIYQILQNEDLTKITADCVVTKLNNIGIIVTPADCAIVALTGIDKSDGQRFVAVMHLGLTGTILNLVSQTVSLIKHQYQIEDSQMQAAIFPHISAKHYRKTLSDKRYLLIKDNPEWKDCLDITETDVGFDFGAMIRKQLTRDGINFEDSGIDNYLPENQLFSHTYLKEHNQDETQRFGVGVAIG